MRMMGLSIAQRLRGMEDRVVDQMRMIPGGSAPLMEYWIEHYH